MVSVSISLHNDERGKFALAATKNNHFNLGLFGRLWKLIDFPRLGHIGVRQEVP